MKVAFIHYCMHQFLIPLCHAFACIKKVKQEFHECPKKIETRCSMQTKAEMMSFEVYEGKSRGWTICSHMHDVGRDYTYACY